MSDSMSKFRNLPRAAGPLICPYKVTIEARNSFYRLRFSHRTRGHRSSNQPNLTKVQPFQTMSDQHSSSTVSSRQISRHWTSKSSALISSTKAELMT